MRRDPSLLYTAVAQYQTKQYYSCNKPYNHRINEKIVVAQDSLSISPSRQKYLAGCVPAININYKLLEIVNRFTLPTIYVLKLDSRYIAFHIKIITGLAKVIIFKPSKPRSGKEGGTTNTCYCTVTSWYSLPGLYLHHTIACERVLILIFGRWFPDCFSCGAFVVSHKFLANPLDLLLRCCWSSTSICHAQVGFDLEFSFIKSKFKSLLVNLCRTLSQMHAPQSCLTLFVHTPTNKIRFLS